MLLAVGVTMVLGCEIADAQQVSPSAPAITAQQAQPQQEPAPSAPPAGTPPEKADPNAPGAPVDPRSYRIGAEDVLSLRIWREPELSGLFTVRPDGKISLLLVGEMDAMDLTPQQLEANIRKAYEQYLKSPLVTLQVQNVQSKKYYISGEINKSGMFPLVSPTTVLQAITMAGGIREFGNPKKIIIMRGSERIKFNYAEVIKGKKLEQNILLRPGDHIVIP
jgi:polysaccharide export outer membrane protein